MKFLNVKNYRELSVITAQTMINAIKDNPCANICLASGASPDLAYQLFVQMVIEQSIDISHAMFTKLDEWCGFDGDHEATCEKYIQDRIIKKLNIKRENYITFNPNALDFKKEVEKVGKLLHQYPITLSILGIGKNGHLGLNEPNDYLNPFTHIEILSETTKAHQMLGNEVVDNGMTIGMNEILNSKNILLLISGSNKQEIFNQFLTEKITTKLPASFLWLHPNTTSIVQTDVFHY